MSEREFPWLTTKEVAERSGLKSQAAVSQSIGDGRLKARRVGREWLIHEEDYAEWMREYRPKPRRARK